MWPVNIQPKIKERQMLFQSLAGKDYVFLRKPGSKPMFAAYMAFFTVTVGMNMYGLVKYGMGIAEKNEE